MVVCSPSDPIEARALTTFSSSYDGPMYIQLGKAGEKIIHNDELSLSKGDILPFRVESKCKAVIVTGSIASVIVNSDKAEGADVYTLPFIKPINKEQLIKIADKYDFITIVEEHQKSCGVGSAVIEQGLIKRFPKVKRIAIDDYFQNISGSQQFLRGKAGLI